MYNPQRYPLPARSVPLPTSGRSCLSPSASASLNPPRSLASHSATRTPNFIIIISLAWYLSCTTA